MSALAALRAARRRILRRQQTVFALLGNGSGTIRAGGGLVWVRFPGSVDSNGNATYTPPTKVNAGTANYFVYEGAGVRVGVDDNGELTVMGSDHRDAKNAGLDTGILNTGTPERKFIRLKNIVNFKSMAVGNADNTSTLVSVQNLIYQSNNGDLLYYPGTPLQADKVDLVSYIPTAGNHRIAVVFMNIVTQAEVVYASTTQAQSSALDFTDYQECVDQSYLGREIPIQAYKLANGATAIDQRDLGEDLRQFINMPPVFGFPNPVDKNVYIHDGYTVQVCDDVVVTGNLLIAGKFICNSITTSGAGSVTTSGSGALVTSGCSSSPVLIEIDDTDSPYTATTQSLEITIIADTTSGDITINLPPIANNLNQRYSIKNIGTGTITIDPNASETIDGQTTLSVIYQYDAPRIVATSTEWSII